MANDWQALKLSDIVPTEITSVASDITSLIQQFIEIQQTAIALAKLYASSLGSSVDILHTLIQTLTDIIEGLLQAGKIHILFVPMSKVFPQSPADRFVPPTLTDAAVALGFNFVEAGNIFASGANSSYIELVGRRGGNASFFNVFLESLGDLGDINRPQYLNQGDAVSMTVIMLGAPSFSELVEVASAFNRVFRPTGNSDLTARMVPTPQGLRARVIGLPTAKHIGVRLDWEPPRTAYDSPYFPRVSIRVTKYAVIRSTSARAAAARTIFDFFTTQNLTVGVTSTDNAHASKVIAIGSGSNSSFVDDDESLDANVSYYYTVAWQTEINENGKVTTLPFERLSNVVKTRVKAATPTQASVPPDWIARGSALDLIPDLAVTVETMLERIKVIGDRRSTGASDSLLASLDLMQKNLDQFLARINQLNNTVGRLVAAFATPLPGLYTTQITGIGGNAFLISELARRLTDKSDPNRPPYDNNEYVMGICVVAGGPRLPDIQPYIDLASLLFQSPSPANPLLNVLNAMGGVVLQQEQHVFGPDMKNLPIDSDGNVTFPGTGPFPAGTTVPAISVDPRTGLPAIDPVTGQPATTANPNTGVPIVTDRPVTGNDGTPIVGTDPANPNTGFTNEKTDKDLC